MAGERQPVGAALGNAFVRIRDRERDAFLASRPDPGAPLDPAELDALLTKIWAALGAVITPISPDSTIAVGTQNDANGDPQLTLRALSSGTAHETSVPRALYQFWRGTKYGLRDASGDGRHLTVSAGAVQVAELPTYGDGLVFDGSTMLSSADMSGLFQYTGDISVVVAFKLTELPASGTFRALFVVNDEGSSEAENANIILNVADDGALVVHHEYGQNVAEQHRFATGFEAGKLYWLAVVRKGTALLVYLNGEGKGSDTIVHPPTGCSAGAMSIGGSPTRPSEGIKAVLVSLAFYKAGLAVEEIAALYRAEMMIWACRNGRDGAPGPKGDKGDTGNAGPAGADGSDGATILHGSGVPADASGNPSDLYLDDSSGDYYIKGASTWGAPAGNIKQGFITGYSVDFSTLPAQNLLTGGDGAKTIDGKAWSLANAANLQTAYLNDGSHAGLYLRCSTASTTNDGAALSGGALYVPLSTLNNVFLNGPMSAVSEVWLWLMYEMPHLPDYNSEQAHCGLLWNFSSYAAGSLVRYGTQSFYYNGLYYGQGHFNFGSVSTWAGGRAAPAVDVAAFRFRHGSIYAYFGASVAGNFPARSDLSIARAASRTLPLSSTAGAQMYHDAMYAWISVTSGNTRGNADMLLKKLLVEYR